MNTLGNLGAVYGLQPAVEHAAPHREPHVLDYHGGGGVDVNHHTVVTEHHGVPHQQQEPGII